MAAVERVGLRYHHNLKFNHYHQENIGAVDQGMTVRKKYAEGEQECYDIVYDIVEEGRVGSCGKHGRRACGSGEHVRRALSFEKGQVGNCS